MPISDSHLDHLRTNGYVLVEDFLDPSELGRCQDEMRRHFPDGKELTAAPERYSELRKSAGFPFPGDALNHVSTHPDIIAALEKLLATSDLRLGHSLLQAKYGAPSFRGTEQRLHHDSWGRRFLAYPRTDGLYQRILGIVYYSDVTEETGPTFMVPRQFTSGAPLLPQSGYGAYFREHHPELYEHEKPITAPAGSLLLFSGQTVHRGSNVQLPTGHRFAQCLAYHSARASAWMDHPRYAASPASPLGPTMRRFMEKASPAQRELLGFPAPADTYWTEETLRGTAELYPGMDLAPYRDA